MISVGKFLTLNLWFSYPSGIFCDIVMSCLMMWWPDRPTMTCLNIYITRDRPPTINPRCCEINVIFQFNYIQITQDHTIELSQHSFCFHQLMERKNISPGPPPTIISLVRCVLPYKCYLCFDLFNSIFGWLWISVPFTPQLKPHESLICSWWDDHRLITVYFYHTLYS